MWHSAETIVVIEYLPDYESAFKMPSASHLGDPGVGLPEKSLGLKISRYCLFKVEATVL
jgi:hypothetical protein